MNIIFVTAFFKYFYCMDFYCCSTLFLFVTLACTIIGKSCCKLQYSTSLLVGSMTLLQNHSIENHVI